MLNRALAAAAAAALLLAGCGDSDNGGGAEPGFTDKSAEEIKDAALEAMADLDSVALKGEITTDGEKIALDIKVGSDGDCAGSMTIQGATAEIVAVDGVGYLKGDEAFWSTSTGSEQQGATMSQLIGDRWVNVGDSGGFSDELCDLEKLLEDPDEEEYEKGEVEEINGIEAIALLVTDAEGEKSTAWVATSSDHYLVRMGATEGSEPGQIDFTDFNEEFTIEAPTGDDVVDLESLTGG